MAERWIPGAIRHPGTLRATAGVKKGQKIPVERLEELAHSKDKTTAKRARLAQTLRKLGK
jgi:hypothetical protein